MSLRVAIVGGGWAGLAAAVRSTQLGHMVTVFEMSQSWGGRARVVRNNGDGLELDNGQHILIGAYLRTLDLMQTVGVQPSAALHRQPLELRYPDGRGLRLPPGPAWLGLGWAAWRCQGWSSSDAWALLREGAIWARHGFTCDNSTTVAALCARLPPAVRELLIDPLCVAALNTPADQASGTVFLRVLRDSMFNGPGSADLLLPRKGLSALLPEPAARWLAVHGAVVKLGHRVQALQHESGAWLIDGERFDAVVLACSAAEAARLAKDHAPDWAEQAQALRYEPIVTVWVQADGVQLPCPMLALVASPYEPAQFVFDHGRLSGHPGRLAFVISGAREWVERGSQRTCEAVLDQAKACIAAACGAAKSPLPPTPAVRILKVLAEKRATFRCTPRLVRPPMQVAQSARSRSITEPAAPLLLAAGDYVLGPYPATLEGAVRSGEAAAAALQPSIANDLKASGAVLQTAPPAAPQ